MEIKLKKVLIKDTQDFSSGSGYYGGTTKTKTTSQGADDKKVAYQLSAKGKANAKKAATISKRNKIKKDMEDFAKLHISKTNWFSKIFSCITVFRYNWHW